jgi:hypothetical protein
MTQPNRQNRRARRASLHATGTRGRIALAVGDGPELPTEFRLFVRGDNATEKGKYVFDDAAARSVMAAYRKWGIDVPIDLEHQMLDLDGGEADPTARDARGWCKLELRPDGSLWAVAVRWTPDGASRLTEKRQRYVSPAFDFDPKTRRVLKLVNIALTAIPATHGTPALVAASRGTHMGDLERAKNLVTLAAGMGLDPSLVTKALEAIEKGDAKAALDILKGLVASAAGADPEPDGDEPGSEGDGAEGTTPDAPPADMSAAPPPPASGDDSDDDKDEDEPAKKAANRALRASLRRMTGKATFAEAVVEVETWRQSHLSLETQRTQLATERAILESAERRKHVVELVKLGAEFPATVFVDPLKKDGAIKERWLKMPLAELRSHVAEQRAARKAPAVASPGVKPPPGDATSDGDEDVKLDDGRVVRLSTSEVRACKRNKCELKDFAVLKALRDSKKGS